GYRHCHGNGDGKLAIQLARQSAEKTDRDEDGGQHDNNGHNRSADFAHGLNGGFARRFAVLRHDAFDVLDDDDGVVHHDTDRQQQAEQGQQIDGEAEQPQSDEGADYGDRNRKQRNDGGTEVLQEQEHQQNNENERLDEGLDASIK